jgi:radical SAM superfamily enzyme
MSFLFRVTPYNYYIVIFLEEAQKLCAKDIQFRRLYVLQVLTDTTMKNTYHKR